MKNRVKIIISILIITSGIFFVSYKHSRIQTDEILKPFLKNELYYLGTSFHPFDSKRDKQNKKYFIGPTWNIFYDHQTQMLTGPLSFRTSMTGKIIDTIPRNLREEILPKQLIIQNNK